MIAWLTQIFLSTSTGSVLLASLLEATLVLALAQWLVSAMPGLSAAARHFVLWLALASFLLIPALSLLLPRWNLHIVPSPPSTQVSEPASRPASEPLPAAEMFSNTTSAAPSAGSPLMQPYAIAALSWGIIALLLMSRLGIAGLRLRSIVRNADFPSEHLQTILAEARTAIPVKHEIRLRVTGEVAVPMVWGFRKATLLLPPVACEWPDEQLRATIVHELGHLQRLDYLTLTLMNLVSSLFWFHPQVWTARRRALTEGEHACDDLVLRSGARASEYASHLLSVARLMPRREPLAAILAMSRPSQLEGRMYSILSPSVNRKPIGGKLLMFSTFGFLVLVAPLATMQISAEASTPPPSPPVTVAALSDSPHSSHSESREIRRSHRMSSHDENGLCSDYDHSFNGDPVVRAQSTLTYSGHQLDVTGGENGAVSLRHATGSSFGITICKSASGASEAEARQLLEQIGAREVAGKLAGYGPKDNDDWSIDLIITVPDGTDVSVRGQNGPVSFREVNATIDASVENGPLSLRDSHGEIKAHAVNGPLSIEGVSGNVNLATENGPLTVSLDGSSWNDGELHASVENGPLSLEIPAGYQTGVDLSANGHVPFRCRAALCGDADKFDERDGRAESKRKVSFGSGPTRIYLEGGNGPVTVSEKD